MSTKEKPRPLVAQGAGQVETATGKAHSFYCNHTTVEISCQERLKISDVLPRERKNALKMCDLKELFGKDSRTIRSMIQEERKSVPILSDNSSGYWISDDPSEVQEFSRSMKSRSKQIWRTATNVEKAAGLTQHEQIEGQEALF